MNPSQSKISMYFERNPELRILFVFNDPFLEYELEQTEWKPGYRYVKFKGDWFTTKYRFENDWADEKVILYFEQASPLKSKKDAAAFPLIDLLIANQEYHHQDSVAFMQQYNIPGNMAKFVESNIQQLQNSRMIKMLESYYRDGSISNDLATRAFLSAYLGLPRILDWDTLIIRILTLARKEEENKYADFCNKLKESTTVYQALADKLSSIFGVECRKEIGIPAEKIIESFKYNAITQNLAKVTSDNYTALEITDALRLQQMNRMLEKALSDSKTEQALLDTFDELGANIREEDIIKWYGASARYYFIPERLVEKILENLMPKVAEDPQAVIGRIEELFLKTGEGTTIYKVMQFVLTAARYYELVQSIGAFSVSTAKEVAEKYCSDYYRIDQLYRQALEAYFKIDPDSALFGVSQAVKVQLDLAYAKTNNRMNLVWTKKLKEDGINSLELLRQEDFFDKCVRPLQRKVAVIVSDALRYEIAEQVIEELAIYHHTANLTAAIAMLPTETKYCKPALLPYTSLNLYGVSGDQNMSVDQKILNTIADRSAQLGKYKSGSICVSFNEVAKYDTDKNREEIFNDRPIVYIFHDDIDNAGHDGVARHITEQISSSVENLTTMIRKILSSYNVTEVILTSDHGFLFNDIEFVDKDKQKVTEPTLEKKSRYYLTESSAEVPGVVKFNLEDVSGMNNGQGIYVAVPEGTNRFAAPSGGYNFAHGGASLQELIIPVIYCHQKRGDKRIPVRVMLLHGDNLKVAASRLRVNLLQTEPVDAEHKERTIRIALYDGGKPVSQEKTVILNKTDKSLDNRQILVNLTLNKKVSACVLQLIAYDEEDALNPILKENVRNMTLIQTDDFDI